MRDKYLISVQNILRNKTLLTYLAIVLCIYLPSLYFDFFIFDDKENIIANSKIANIFDLFDPWQRTKIPLTYNYWQVINFIFGNQSALPFRLFNILFHCINGLLVLNISKKIFNNEKMATIATGLFLIHPVNVQSIIWVSSSREILATLFTLISVNIFLNDRKSNTSLFLSFLFWSMSILFKPISLVVPLLIPLLLSQSKGSRLDRKLVILTLLYFVFAIITFIFYIDEINKSIPLNNFPIINYLGSFVVTAVIYLKNYFIPFSLEFNYSITPKYLDNLINSFNFIYYVLILSSLLVIATLSKNKFYRNCLISFLLLISINSGLIPFSHQFISTVTDRYLYLPSISLIFFFVFLLSNISRRKCNIITISTSLLLICISMNEVSKWRSSSDRLYNESTTDQIKKISYANALIWDKKYSKASLFLKSSLFTKNYTDSNLFYDYLSVRLSLFNSLPKDDSYERTRAIIKENIQNIHKDFYPLIANYAYQNNDFDLARVAYSYSQIQKNNYLIDFNLKTLTADQENYEDSIMTKVSLLPSNRRLDHISKRLYQILRPLIINKEKYDRTFKERFK